MRFTDIAPDENFPLTHLTSETGRWELGLRPMLFGVRVSAGLVGHDSVTVDYCAGASPVTQRLLLRMLRTILEAQPESVTPAEVQRMMPSYQRRPIDRDPVCWMRLVEMAAACAAGVPA